MKQILTFLFLLAPLALMGQTISRTELRNTNTQVDARMALKANTNAPNLFTPTNHGRVTFRGGTNLFQSPGNRGQLSYSASGSEYYQTLWWVTGYQLLESDSGLRFLTLTNESGDFALTLKADTIVLDSDEVDFTGQIFGGDIFSGGTNLHTLAAQGGGGSGSAIATLNGFGTNTTFQTNTFALGTIYSGIGAYQFWGDDEELLWGGIRTNGTLARLAMYAYKGTASSGSNSHLLVEVEKDNYGLLEFGSVTSGNSGILSVETTASTIDMYLKNSGVQKLTFKANSSGGFIGVNTNNPAASLHVVGNTIHNGLSAFQPTNLNNVGSASVNSNALPHTNFVGVIEMAAAATMFHNAALASEWSITNRIGAATTIVETNTVAGQILSGTVIGEASGGAPRVVTFQPDLGHLVANLDDLSGALALTFSVTLTNGNALEWNDSIRKLNGTNVHKFVTRQFKF